MRLLRGSGVCEGLMTLRMRLNNSFSEPKSSNHPEKHDPLSHFSSKNNDQKLVLFEF
jgi:hypothetical protein